MQDKYQIAGRFANGISAENNNLNDSRMPIDYSSVKH